MKTSRRDFLTMFTAAGGAFVAPKGLYAALAPERKLRLGVCSDIHIGFESPELWKWKKALEYFRDQKVDAVVVSGDLANRGLIKELRAVMDTWWEVFPGGKRPDGEPVEHVFVTGNHDPAVCRELQDKYRLRNPDGTPKTVAKDEIGFDLEGVKTEALLFNREKLWPELFHEEYSHFFVKQVKGYYFIGSNWRSSWPKHVYEAEELPQYLKDHAAELGKTKPFFFIQHCHPRGTCHGVDAWWPDSGKNTTEVLKDFPNAVCFSGHSHDPITDLKAIWQGGFTSIGSGSLSYCSPLGRDPKPDITAQADAPAGHPWKITNGDCHMAYIIDVHDGFLAARPIEIRHLEALSDEIIIPVPVKPDPDFAFEKRAAAKRPPAYTKQPKVEIRDVKLKNWKGEEYPMQEVAFAAVPQGDHAFSRVYAYEVTMRPKDGSPTIVRNVRSAAGDMAPKMEPDTVLWHVKPGTFGAVADYDIEIVPIDSFRTHAKRATKCAAVVGMRIEKAPAGWSVDNYCQDGAKAGTFIGMFFRSMCKDYDAYVIFANDEKSKKEAAGHRKLIERKQPEARVIVAATPEEAAAELSGAKVG